MTFNTLFGYPIESSDDDAILAPALRFPLSLKQLASSVMPAIHVATYLALFQLDHQINPDTGDYCLRYINREGASQKVLVINLNGLPSDESALAAAIYPALKNALKRIIDDSL